MNVKDILIAARALVAKGWIQGHMGDDIVGYCMIGAIKTAACGHVDTVGINDNYVGARDVLRAVIVKRKFYHLTVSSFNDDPETRLADVLSVFDEAIACCI